MEGSWFYVLTMAEKDGSRRTYLDAYALDDGSYLHSYELPPRCTTAEIRGSQLLTITPEEMTLWQLEESGGDPA